jgi:hypothetical protein
MAVQASVDNLSRVVMCSFAVLPPLRRVYGRGTIAVHVACIKLLNYILQSSFILI